MAMMSALAAGLALAGAPSLAAGKDTLAVGLQGDPASLDPQVQWDTDSYTVYRNIFDNLLTRDAQGKIQPQIAKSWRYASDTEIDFEIRSDVVFHDGSALKPEDVVFSVKRITNPAFKSPQLSQFNTIVDAKITAPGVVRVTTSSPYPALLGQLVKLSIVPETAVKKLGDVEFNQQPLGSGPYRLASWQRGVKVTLEANPAYWRGKAPFEHVEFRGVPDAATRVADLRTGKADVIRGLNPDDTQPIVGDANLKILSVPTERIGYMFLNALWGPTADVRVRQAIAYAVDRKLIIEALLAGYGKMVNIVLTPANFGYIDGFQGYPHDPAKAKALLKEAKQENAELVFITSPVYDQRVVQAIQQMLGEVGLKVRISSTDQPTFLKRRQGNPEDAGNMSTGNWSCACQDADGVIYPLFRSDSIWSKYKNPEFDIVVDAARSTLDEQKRLANYRKAFELLERDVPGIGLYQNVAIYAARKEFLWQPTPNESFFAFDMKWQ
ncbi:MAG: peptide ABC transporter [Proteobacteria bacterium]|nr:peptide ABC transporter [Pseudomonadota bacterium]MBI3497119.1 peptide ABC transporter [Pseudomonadota bacterium]